MTSVVGSLLNNLFSDTKIVKIVSETKKMTKENKKGGFLWSTLYTVALSIFNNQVPDIFSIFHEPLFVLHRRNQSNWQKTNDLVDRLILVHPTEKIIRKYINLCSISNRVFLCFFFLLWQMHLVHKMTMGITFELIACKQNLYPRDQSPFVMLTVIGFFHIIREKLYWKNAGYLWNRIMKNRK